MNPSLLTRPDQATAARLAAAIKKRWRDGDPPDAAAALAEHPELLRFKSVVIDLGFEEYCLREERGEAPAPGPFCDRMPVFRSSLHKVLDAHRLIVDYPEVLDPAAGPYPEPGEEFDGLAVVCELGRGGFARAYLAHDPGTNRDCVLKLSPTRGGEGRTLGPLSHPHVTDVYWARRVGGLNAVCMPFHGAATLEDVRDAVFGGAGPRPRSSDLILGVVDDTLPQGPPAQAGRPAVVRPGESFPAGVASVAARVADALAYLHAQGLEHGDLKPSNVVLGAGGRPYLIDFNLGGQVADAVGVGGTVPYMAPERLRALAGGPVGSADRTRADVYALGVLVFELLTGRTPWAPGTGLDPKAAAAELLALRAASPTPTWPPVADVPAPLARVVERCLAAEPDDRPTAAAVAAALDGWLAAERGEVARPRRRWAVRALTAAAVLAGLAAVAWLRPLSRPADPPSSAAQAGEAPPLAMERPPETAEQFFDRGRRYLRQNSRASWSAALNDFEQANDRGYGPAALAYSAYTLTLLGPPDVAAERGKDALKAKATSAAVNNNIGYALMKAGADREKDALGFLNTAVALDPNLRAARYNRALLGYQTSKEVIQRPGQVDQIRLKDWQCVEDIQRVIDQPPDSAEAYTYAARIFAAGSYHDPRLRDEAIRCLRKAIELGEVPSKLKETVFTSNLADHPEFDVLRLLQRPPGTIKAPNIRVAEPDVP